MIDVHDVIKEGITVYKLLSQTLKMIHAHEKISFDTVYQELPNSEIVGVQEYYLPGITFTDTMPDGSLCQEHTDVIKVLHTLRGAGATCVQLRILTATRRTVYRDIYLNILYSNNPNLCLIQQH